MYIILSIFVTYAVGILSYEYNFFFYYFLVVFVALLYNSIKTSKFIYNFTILSFLILSFVNCYYNSKSSISQYINHNIEVVAAIEKRNDGASDSRFDSYNAKILTINGITFSSKENTILYVDKNTVIEENSLAELKGSVSEINYGKNFLIFNYKNYLRSKKIHAAVFADGKINILKEKYSKLYDVSAGFREYSEYLFYTNFNKENAEIILSVILGDVDYLDEDFYDNIKTMGLAHIFAVSGSHIVLLYAFILKLLRIAGLKRRTSWIITWALIWFYGFLIGFPLSVMRTLVMFTLLFGSEFIYRKYNSLNSISLSALVLTIYNPYWIFDAGFLLSFSAALSLILYSRYVSGLLRTKFKILKDAYMYLFLQIFTLPVIAYYFNYLPVMGIFYNLLLLPVFTFILICSFSLLILNVIFSFLLILPFKLFDYFLYALRFFINLTENFAFNGIEIRTLSACENIFFYIFILLILYLMNSRRTNFYKCSLTVYFSFYILTFIIVPSFDESLHVNIADAGQGLFSIVSYKNYDFVIDCGSSSSKNFGEYTVVPYLKKKGIKDVDIVFISHWDADHYSGLEDLDKSRIKIKNIFSSSENDSVDIKEKITVLESGDSIEIDDKLKIYILWPEDGCEQDNINNESLVLIINYDGRTILFPGDIESDAENMLKGDIKSDIIIVPHHGSSTSSGKKLVEESSPEYAVISYGKNNYGMPSEEVLSRYEKAGSKIISTFEEGEINFVLNGDEMYYNTYEGLKSENINELYLEWILPKLVLFGFLLIWILHEREKRHEL